MSDLKPKPAFDAARRIKWLMTGVLAAVGLYTGGWFYAAREVGGQVSAQLDQLATQGVAIDCPDRNVRGFPFRIGVFCSDFAVDAASQRLALKGGAFRSTAQVYNPRRVDRRAHV